MKKIILSIAAVAALAAPAFAADTTLVSDDFDAATTGTAGAGGLGYYPTINSGTLAVIDPGITNKSLEMLHTINNAAGAGPIKSFASSGSNITLAATGDKLDLTLSVRAKADWYNLGATAADQFRLGFLNYTGTTGGSSVAVAATLLNASHTYTGYFGAIGTAVSGSSNGIFQSEASNIGGNNRIFYAGNGTTNTELLNISGTNSITPTIAPFGGVNDTTVYTLSLSLERVDTGLQITLGKGSESASFTDTSSPYYSFNSFALVNERRNANGTENSFWVDDLSVVYTLVPEPSTFVALMGGAGVLAMFRRRRV